MGDAAEETTAPDLGEYLGKKITSTSVIIKNAGDGLSKAMEISAVVLEPGTRGQVLLDFVVEEHKLKLIEKADSYEMKQVFRAETVLLVDDAASKKRLAAMKNRIERAAEQSKGKERLPGTENAVRGDEEDDPPDNVHSIGGKDAAAGERPDPEWDEDDRST